VRGTHALHVQHPAVVDAADDKATMPFAKQPLNL